MVFDEEKFIVNSFEKNFKEYIGKPIVIYGLGKNTKVILNNCKTFDIVGLMDGTRSGDYIWDKKVLDIEELLELNVKNIIIVATSANVSIIYRRIALFCEEHDINVYDINGNKLERNTKQYVFPTKYNVIKKEKLIKLIDLCDVISFDVFDTLLVRSTLIPTDVFEMVCKKIKKLLKEDFDFIKCRIESEQELYKTTNPNIYEIYERMVVKGLEEDIAKLALEKEIEIEEQVLLAREAMKEIMSYAIFQGKKICCTSDMYLPSENIKKILIKAGYYKEVEVFVSCEYRMSKNSGLYEVVRNRYPDKKILHIGDNQTADGIMSVKYGIDKSFVISSSYQMLEDSKQNVLMDFSYNFENRSCIGKYVSRIFNNPFLFEKTMGKGRIDSEYDLGYYYLEPIMRKFIEWMVKICREQKIEHILLASRDGWFIKEMLDILSKYKKTDFTYEYFYASRLACTVAGIKSEEDVVYVSSLAFDGTIEEMLSKRFLLNKSQILTRNNNESDRGYLCRHTNLILENAKKYRQNYMKYINSLDLPAKKIGFFDFVSSGTCQFWLEKIMNTSIEGLYFIKNYDSYKDNIKIYSMYEPKNVYEKQSKVYDNYIFVESILTSPEPSLKYIDVNGKPVFEKDKRTASEIDMLKKIHCGIKEAFICNLEAETNLQSIEISETILDFVKTEYSIMNIDFLKESILEDEFCNRKFELKNIVGGLE